MLWREAGCFLKQKREACEVEGRLEPTAQLMRLRVRDRATKDSKDSNFYNYQVSY